MKINKLEFEECKNCMYKEHNEEILCCLSSRLSLAAHNLFKEVGIINKDKYCNWYLKDTEV